jgi:NAD(P)-dependent dehydrogenase (short-subunit alcohol dehydrogenase family)
MALQGEKALVLGASGVIGYGAAYNFLKEGATVAVVSRTEDKLKELLHDLAEFKDRVVGVIGSFDSKKSVEAMYSLVKKGLNGSPDHVVSSIGFVEITPKGVLTADPITLAKSFEASLFPTILVAQVVLGDIRNKEGATFTLETGGFRHGVYFPGMWAATIKNTAMHALFQGFAADTVDNKVRVNEACLHSSIARPGKSANQLGIPNVLNSLEYGVIFPSIVHNKKLKGDIICTDTISDVESFVHSGKFWNKKEVESKEG